MNRQQEKAMFAKQRNNPTRADVRPSLLARARETQQKIAQRIRERRERKGQERIRAEKVALERERATTERLKAELETEQAREQVAQQRAETQAEFAKIEKARRERKLAPIRAVVGTGIAGFKAVGKSIGAVEKATRPKKARARKKKAPAQEQGFFGI